MRRGIQRVRLDWEGASALDRPVRDRFADLGADGTLRLADSFLLADESGRTTRRNREVVSGAVRIRKTFVVPAVPPKGALLLFYASSNPARAALRIEANGRPLVVRRSSQRDFWDRHWVRLPVPARFLKEGENEFVFRALGRSRWAFLIENSFVPDRSARSLDGGRTWASEFFGENGVQDGEYLVRLRLLGWPSSGEVVSEAVDPFAHAAVGGIPARGQIRRIGVRIEGERPAGTRVEAFWRAGPDPAYDPATWTAWARSGSRAAPPPSARFVQWRLVLSTRDPAVSPSVRAVRLRADLDVPVGAARPASAAPVAIPDRRSAYPFAALRPDNKRGRILRRRWRLSAVVRGAGSTFEKFVRLRNWARRRWSDGWVWGATDFCPPWDSLLILELAPRGLSLGMCTHYATVFSHAAAALGLMARTVILRGHCANEAWSPEHGKWVFMDLGADHDDRTRFTYHFERNGVPLSALEAHLAWKEKAFSGVRIVPTPPGSRRGFFTPESRLALFDRFAVTLRNDELLALEPGEPEHGALSFSWDGYLWWRDEDRPLPWFSRQTTRAADLEWTPDGARIHLRETARPGVLEVLLESPMPNLVGFRAREGSGPWRARPARFHWRLRPGENRLEARPVNGFGVEGTAGAVTVETPRRRA